MRSYWIKICRVDGSTPLGCCPVYEVVASGHLAAQQLVHEAHPGHETVCWGAKADILRRRAENHDLDMWPESVEKIEIR